jgi:hypothetical protein
MPSLTGFWFRQIGRITACRRRPASSSAELAAGAGRLREAVAAASARLALVARALPPAMVTGDTAALSEEPEWQ